VTGTYLLPNYEIILKKYIHMAVFPHSIDGKIVACENAEWLVWKTTCHSHIKQRKAAI